ncbi:MAG: serine hydrolase, partial [Pseudomonadota bacterium]
MKRFITIAAMTIFGSSASSIPQAAHAQSLDLQAVLENAQTSHDIIGMGAIVMHHDGSYTIAVSGERAVNSHDLIQENDHWHIGSNTKSITALLYGRLVEAG